MSLQTVFEGDVSKVTKQILVGTEGAPVEDSELANKEYVDDSVNSIEHWLRDSGSQTIYPRVPGDKMAGGLTVGGSFLIESTLDPTKGPIDIVASEVIISNDLQVDVIDEKTGAAGVTIDSLLVKDGRATNSSDSAPTTDPELANKKYVDDSMSAAVWTRTVNDIKPTVASGVLTIDNIVEEGSGGVTIESINVKDNIIKNTSLDLTIEVPNSRDVIISDGSEIARFHPNPPFSSLIVPAILGSTDPNGVLFITSTSDPVKGNVAITGAQINLFGDFVIGSSIAIDDILDEDNMVSNSATALVSQQSVKAYVDSGDVFVRTVNDIAPTSANGILTIDTINEETGAAGITIDSLLVKDGRATNSTDAAPTTDPELANKKYVDDSIPTELPLAIDSAVSEGNSSTTGTSFVQKVKLTFTALASDYLISWYAEVNSTDSGTRVEVQVEQDDTTVLATTDWNPDESSGTGYGPQSGLAIVTLTAASHDFDIDFSSSQGGNSVQIRRARIVATQIQ